MTRKGLERRLVVLLFVLVLIASFFAERDSKKLERLYTTAQLLEKTPNVLLMLPAIAKANKSLAISSH